MRVLLRGGVNDVPMTASEKIRLIAKRKGKAMGDIAELTGQSRQNLSNKMQRDNFSIAELNKIAAALDCSVDVSFIDNQTGEKI